MEKENSKQKNMELSQLTSSACLPPSYRTINTLTFSRAECVSDRKVVMEPSLVRLGVLLAERMPLAAACLDETPAARAADSLRPDARAGDAE